MLYSSFEMKNGTPDLGVVESRKTEPSKNASSDEMKLILSSILNCIFRERSIPIISALFARPRR
jgi:hypothetical protein